MASHLRLAVSSGQSLHAGPAARPIRVVLADDHAMIRRTMRVLLDRQRDVHVSAEASDLTSVTDHVHRQTPHVLVLDLRLPNGSSLEAIRHLRAESPDMQIVALTMEDSPQFAQQALRAGAVGFVLKDQADRELITAVRLAARGEEYVSPRVAAGLDVLLRAGGSEVLSARGSEVTSDRVAWRPVDPIVEL